MIGVTVGIACTAMLCFEFWVWLVCVLFFSGVWWFMVGLVMLVIDFMVWLLCVCVVA